MDEKNLPCSTLNNSPDRNALPGHSFRPLPVPLGLLAPLSMLNGRAGIDQQDVSGKADYMPRVEEMRGGFIYPRDD